MNDLYLGIDVGTTKVSAVLTSRDGTFYETASRDHAAALSGPPGYAEADMDRILIALQEALNGFPDEARRRIAAIGITGQMHSVILWSRDCEEKSRVITWQDKRASASGRLDDFRRRSGLPLADGFGSVSLAELALSGSLDSWECAGTPADYLAARMTQSDAAVMEPSFAASWGVFDLRSMEWNRAAIRKLGLPERFFPRIVSAGTVIGYTKGYSGLRDGIPVTVPVGDNQASVYGTCRDPENELFLTLGTGAQLSAVLRREEAEAYGFSPEIELRPFMDGRLLAVAAPLCGGRAWTWLAETVNGFLLSLGLPPFPEKQLLDRLDELAMQADLSGTLTVNPNFLGTRLCPEERGRIEGISIRNFTLSNLAGALGDGMIRSLCSVFPADFLRSRKRILGSGNCLRFCQSLQGSVRRQTGLELVMRDTKEEAAKGAAETAFFLKRK